MADKLLSLEMDATFASGETQTLIAGLTQGALIAPWSIRCIKEATDEPITSCSEITWPLA